MMLVWPASLLVHMQGARTILLGQLAQLTAISDFVR